MKSHNFSVLQVTKAGCGGGVGARNDTSKHFEVQRSVPWSKYTKEPFHYPNDQNVLRAISKQLAAVSKPRLFVKGIPCGRNNRTWSKCS